MSEADRLNAVLAERAPAVAAMLSPLGRAVAFPKGIPFQAAAAKGTSLNGTIGQVTDGAGRPLPLPVLADAAGELDEKVTFLYSPQSGHPSIRSGWLARQRALAGDDGNTPATLPFITHGLTHGIGLMADMLVDADTTVILPAPSWENYRLLFTMRTGAKVVTYPFFRDGRFDLESLGAALDAVEGKAVVVLNFPANPTGYSPTPAEADRIVARVAAHEGPLAVLVDDAYQGVVHEEGLLDHSLYWRLARAVDAARTLVVKIDGATKELLFFPSRVGFLTANLTDAEAIAAWESKLNCIVRGSVGGPPGPSQAMMQAALDHHDRTQEEFGERLAELTARYRALSAALDAVDNDRLVRFPFNSAYFAIIGLAEGIDPHVVREKLIAEEDVGLIALPSVNALRVAYCSTRAEDVAEIVRRLDRVVAAL